METALTATPAATALALLPELVTVISDCRLVDASGEQWTYWRRNGKGLAQGWYVVTRPRGESCRHFKDDVEFRGPFGSRARAELLLAQLIDAHRRLAAPPSEDQSTAPLLRRPQPVGATLPPFPSAVEPG